MPPKSKGTSKNKNKSKNEIDNQTHESVKQFMNDAQVQKKQRKLKMNSLSVKTMIVF